MSMNFPKHPELAEEVEAYLAASEMRPTTFGKRAAGDPALIATLKAGRELRSDLQKRIRRFMLTGVEYAPENRKEAGHA